MITARQLKARETSAGAGRCRLFPAAALTFLFLFTILMSPARVRGALSTEEGNAKAAFSDAPLTYTTYITKTSIRFTFTKRKDLTGYLIYMSDRSSGGYKRVARSKTRVYRVRDLLPGKTYYFKMRGYRKDGNGCRYTRWTGPAPLSCPLRRGKSTLKKLLQTGFMPLGSTMYVWGGGWNEADNGAGVEAVTIGVSPRWRQFYLEQDPSYDHNTTRYQIHDGLDCSGYVGWCIYNILNTQSGKKGYVMYAKDMCASFASRGWGEYIPAGRVTGHRAGDIMCNSGHVWIVVGECSDGSVVILHCSPPGVILCGTPSRTGKSNSRAAALAAKYMKTHHPDWYRKFPVFTRDSSYLTGYNQMRWDLSGDSVMTDPDGFAQMTADQILARLP